MSQKENLNNDSGAGTAKSLSVPQDPIEFLKTYVGKRVSLKAFGLWRKDFRNLREKMVITDYFIDEIQGKYKVSVENDKVQLRCSRHVLNAISLAWVEIDGVKVVKA